jgi:tRNA G18 (ribose-2'-O)-methylase SpoU
LEDRNISAIIRTAEAFGVGLVCIIHSDKRPKMFNHASSGATNWVNIKYYKNTKTCFNFLRKKGFKIYGALVNPEAELLWDQDYKGKVAVVVGNEPLGLSETAQKMVDKNVYIPMLGLTESLNVSVSAGILMYETIRQKELKNA